MMRRIRGHVTLASLALLLGSGGCATDSPATRKLPSEHPRAGIPQPVEHRLDAEAERRNRIERRKWFEHMHRAAPGVDWRAVERANGAVEQRRRNLLAGRGASANTSHWAEVGSSNLAGRTHIAVIGPDGDTLYVGSSLGGLWRAGLDGAGWEPIGDNLWGGVHDLLALPGEQPGEVDVLVAVTDGGLVHVSRDEGLTWENPSGIGQLDGVRGVALLYGHSLTILVYGRGPSTGGRFTILASTDYGRSFAPRWQSATGWTGWMWVPRTGVGRNRVYVLESGLLRASVDGGHTFPTWSIIATDADRGVLAGSEAGAPTLYAALRVAGQWKLYRSDDAGETWTFTHDIADFWESLVASTLDPDVVVYGGVEAFRSTNGGYHFNKLNDWWDYYGDPVQKLHADIPGLHCWPAPSAPDEEICFVSTDGGTYVSHDGLASVQNISLEGLAVSQYYSTLSSRLDWDRVAGGSQDQGYQIGVVQHTGGPGPTTPLEQVISGDYGHLTSNDGTHDLVFSTYPGFTLIQDGGVSPSLYTVDFPTGSLHAWLPPVVADPVIPGTFHFCADWLYRYDRQSESGWQESLHSLQQFGGSGVAGSYLSALAFAPTDPDRVYAVNDAGRLFHSTDHGVTWEESTDSAPSQHYFYGNAIAVHPQDPLDVAVGGSGYSAPGVIRSTDGGQTWSAEATNLPQTMVYSLAYAEDGSGDLYAGTETGAWRWDRQTGLWENIMANEAPVTIYWSVEAVNDGGTVRYGTYGRGIWDYVLIPGDRDGDGVPDGDDLCPNHADPGQPDADGDGVGDACDNCPELYDTVHANADGDAAGDLCDCHPLDDDVFAIPPEVPGVGWLSPSLVTWESVLPLSGSQTEHVVYRGVLGEFPVGSSAECRVTTTAANRLSDPERPAAGSGFWYLVHGVNSCGEGTLGVWGTGSWRTVPTCAPW